MIRKIIDFVLPEYVFIWFNDVEILCKALNKNANAKRVKEYVITESDWLEQWRFTEKPWFSRRK